MFKHVKPRGFLTAVVNTWPANAPSSSMEVHLKVTWIMVSETEVSKKVVCGEGSRTSSLARALGASPADSVVATGALVLTPPFPG